MQTGGKAGVKGRARLAKRRKTSQRHGNNTLEGRKVEKVGRLDKMRKTKTEQEDLEK